MPSKGDDGNTYVHVYAGGEAGKEKPTRAKDDGRPGKRLTRAEWKDAFFHGEIDKLYPFEDDDRPRKSRAGSGPRLISEPREEAAQAYYNDLLDKDPRRWRVQQTAAKHIAVNFLKLPEESWQTVEDQIVVPVLKQRRLKKPKKLSGAKSKRRKK